jgi:hypothetical protein
MADAYKTLYQGQLPSTVATLATVGALKSWIVKHISIVNVTSGAVTFQLFKNGTTSDFAWTPAAISVPANGMAEWDGTEAMAAAEYFAGVASAATSLSCTISGDEVS